MPETPTIAQRFLEIVRRIPPGMVATYGDVAAMAGAPRSARQVGWALSSLPKDADVPWWRVVNAQGRVSLRPCGAELQTKLLVDEGVELDESGNFELHRYRWEGE